MRICVQQINYDHLYDSQSHRCHSCFPLVQGSCEYGVASFPGLWSDYLWLPGRGLGTTLYI